MLYDKLKDYSKSGIYPFHMPGHKRSDITEEGIIPYNIDITEIDGFDNLHSPNGVISDIQNKAAELYCAENAFILINGSTGGILSAVRSMTHMGDKVIIARNCHKSVYNAAELCCLDVDYIFPDTDDYGIITSVSLETLENKLIQHNSAVKLVIVTSPTYEGVVSDIKSIAEICHKFGALLLVDEAHGAHFPFSDIFPDEALACGADAAVISLHKTLPSLTQTAMLITNSKELSEKLKNNLAVFETSSPSYLLMSSVENCVDFCRKNHSKFKEYAKRLVKFRTDCTSLQKLKLYNPYKNNKVFDYDLGKLVISTAETNISGTKLADILRKEFSVEIEMAYSDYVIAMTSVCDSDEGFDRLLLALKAVDSRLCRECNNKDISLEKLFTGKNFKSCEIEKFAVEKLELSKSAFRTSAEYIWAYPPGIPLVVPGEIISTELINYIDYLIGCKVNVYSTSGNIPHSITVVKNIDKS